MTDAYMALVVAAIAAAATLGAAFIAVVAAYLSSKRDQRRVLYSEAFKVALGWIELLYRVRRRTVDNVPDIVERFHSHQASLTYYQGWIASESRYMARSYARLIKTVKSATEPLILAAWNEKVREPPGNASSKDVDPDVGGAEEAFLRDVRGYLSAWQFRKIAVAARNWQDGG